MHNIVNNLILINKELSAINSNTKVIAVSKTFPLEHIKPAIDYGHLHFGENKVQEAVEKWTEIKEKNNSIKLHLIGKLQTNKVKFCLPLFDFIHSLDNIKLAVETNKAKYLIVILLLDLDFEKNINSAPKTGNNIREDKSKDLALKGEEPLDPYEFDYLLLCNKICGKSHYNMQMKIIVETQEEFDNWYKNQTIFKNSLIVQN